MNIIRFTDIAALRRTLTEANSSRYVAVALDSREITFMPHGAERMLRLADATGAAILYANYYECQHDGTQLAHPVISYQPGSLRNDFDFGPLVLLSTAAALMACDTLPNTSRSDPDGGWYALRLAMSQFGQITAIPEFLYTTQRVDYRLSGQQQHDYVDPRNADYQLAMERVLTRHLRTNGGFVDPAMLRHINPDDGSFAVEASVIIPVRNRVRTIGDAVNSALSQEADFDFNVIVVDNGSTDGTSELLAAINDSRLHVISLTGREGLGIGGCWNEAILSEHCGRFAVQLDSDDVYSGADTLSRIVSTFRREKCAMVVGSYMMTDFDMRPIPPGAITHAEWTAENGTNNALRINGFGAPRAFATNVLRDVLFPNVSYGEDYAVCLRVSREYIVGRIFDTIYNCRRWEGNSDAALSIEQTNAHNQYKDFVRTAEYEARRMLFPSTRPS